MKVFIVKNEHPYWVSMDVIRDISNLLKNKFNAEVVSQVGGHLHIREIDYHLPDCEIVIYDEEKDILRAISYSETRTKLWDIFKERNKQDDILIVLHQRCWGLHNFNESELNFQLKKTTIYTYLPTLDYDYFYHKRLNLPLKDTIEKLFLRTTTGRGDEVKLADMGVTNEMFPPVNLENYLKKAINHRIGLSISGAAEICHRDMEYMAIGLPMMRFEYADEYEPKLIPNYHYISVDRGDLPKDSHLDCRGGDEYIKKYVGRFEEIKNNFEFLEFISKNAREYYQNNCSSENRVNNMIKKLNII